MSSDRRRAYTVAEVAKAFDISNDKVRAMIRSGAIHNTYHEGMVIKIPAAELEGARRLLAGSGRISRKKRRP